MKIITLGAVAAALALAGCADNDAADAEAEPAATETVAVPATSETTVVREVEDGNDGDRVTIGEDGVEADVRDGNTRVRADVDRDPSLTVETD